MILDIDRLVLYIAKTEKWKHDLIFGDIPPSNSTEGMISLRTSFYILLPPFKYTALVVLRMLDDDKSALPS